jgi:hypothetical protein
MEFIDQSKSVLENLSYLSGIFVSIIGIFAIWQLIVAVKSFKVAKEALEQPVSTDLQSVPAMKRRKKTTSKGVVFFCALHKTPDN